MDAYSKDDIDGLSPKTRSKRQWNYIPDEQRILLLEMALEYPERSSRELAVRMVDETGMYISESRAGGWYYLSTILDDFSRYIIHWELCTGMTTEDVKRSVEAAMIKAKVKTKSHLRYYPTMVHAIYQRIWKHF